MLCFRNRVIYKYIKTVTNYATALAAGKVILLQSAGNGFETVH